MFKFEIDAQIPKLMTPEGGRCLDVLLNQVEAFDSDQLQSLLTGADDSKCIRVTIEVADWSPENAEMNALLDAPL